MRSFLFALSLIVAGGVYASPVRLSERSEFLLVTCGPYQHELYSAFGHSAILLYDPDRHFNFVYNYGVFDFDQPNFYLNFARGKNNFKLAVQDYPSFRNFYIYFNRYVHLQRLNLTLEQRQKLFDYLEWNALPENCTYPYDYFYDNCATRIRDVLKHVFGSEIQFNGSFIRSDYTIRELTDLYLQKQPWGDLGIDICLGLPMDKKAAPEEYMFLPEYVEKFFNHTTLGGKPIVLERIKNFEPMPEKVSPSFFQPLTVFGLLLVVTASLSVRDWRRKKATVWFDVVLFEVTGLVGILLVLLWTVTDHRAAAYNFNLLWAFPLHAIAAIYLVRKTTLNLSRYFLFTAILLTLLLAGWFLLPQKLNIFLLPFVGMLLTRSVVLAKLLKKPATGESGG